MKRVIALLLVALFSFAGCSGSVAKPIESSRSTDNTVFTDNTDTPTGSALSPELLEEREKNNSILTTFLESKKSAGQVYDYKELDSGGALLVTLEDAGMPSVGSSEPYKTFCYNVLRLKDNKTTVEAIKYPYGGPEAVLIFYDEDWQSKESPTDGSAPTLYYSFFLWHSGPYGREVMIFVEPNSSTDDVDYEHSAFYGLEPSDNLETTPMYMFDDSCLYRYPAWVFIISEEDLNPSYELRYKDYVLSGEDLLSNSWTIGDAPVKRIDDEYWEKAYNAGG